MIIASINRDVLTRPEHIEALKETMERERIDIAAIQETHRTQENTTKTGEYTIYWGAAKSKKRKDGQDTYNEAGVAIAIHSKWEQCITNVQTHNERHMTIT